MKFLEVAGVRLSAVGLGTWQFGSREWGYGPVYASGIAPEVLPKLFDKFVQADNTITSNAYAYAKTLSAAVQSITPLQTVFPTGNTLPAGLIVPAYPIWICGFAVTLLGNHLPRRHFSRRDEPRATHRLGCDTCAGADSSAA